MDSPLGQGWNHISLHYASRMLNLEISDIVLSNVPISHANVLCLHSLMNSFRLATLRLDGLYPHHDQDWGLVLGTIYFSRLEYLHFANSSSEYMDKIVAQLPEQLPDLDLVFLTTTPTEQFSPQ